jgi:hypothetical protein
LPNRWLCHRRGGEKGTERYLIFALHIEAIGQSIGHAALRLIVTRPIVTP